jgi:hypothetical protein
LELLEILEIGQTYEHWPLREIAVREVARGWKGDPGTLPWLKELAQFNEYEVVRMSAMQELARGWRDDPQIQ